MKEIQDSPHNELLNDMKHTNAKSFNRLTFDNYTLASHQAWHMQPLMVYPP